MDVANQYDIVFSSGVFSYFQSLDYAETVLSKMQKKARYSIGVLHAHDKAKEQEYISCRQKLDPNFLEHYKGLDKLFYPKDFFVDFAEKNNLDIYISDCDKEYVTAPYIYEVYFYKR